MLYKPRCELSGVQVRAIWRTRAARQARPARLPAKPRAPRFARRPAQTLCRSRQGARRSGQSLCAHGCTDPAPVLAHAGSVQAHAPARTTKPEADRSSPQVPRHRIAAMARDLARRSEPHGWAKRPPWRFRLRNRAKVRRQRRTLASPPPPTVQPIRRNRRASPQAAAAWHAGCVRAARSTWGARLRPPRRSA